MKPSERLTPAEQKEYILLEQSCTKYDVLYGWETGTRLKRISV